MQAKKLLEELMSKHAEWGWDDLEDRGFVEIMQAFRFAPEGDQGTVVLAFTVVKDYVRRLLTLQEIPWRGFSVGKLRYENRLYQSGFNAGIQEMQLRTKQKKTRIEKKYIEIADKLHIDIHTTMLIWSFVNGYGRNQQEISQWARKQYSQHKPTTTADYYRWFIFFVEQLSLKDFTLFRDEKPTITEQTSSRSNQQNTPVVKELSKLSDKKVVTTDKKRPIPVNKIAPVNQKSTAKNIHQATLSLHTTLTHKKRKLPLAK